MPAKDWGYDLPQGSRCSIVAVQPRPIRETRQGNKRDAIRWSGGVRLRATLTPYPGTLSGAVGMAEVRAGRNGPCQCMRYRKARAMTIETRPEQNPRHPDVAYLPPRASGLFDPAREYDACGVGFIADLKGAKSHRVIKDALAILENLEHRGAVGADPHRRRRRGHSHSDPARISRGGMREPRRQAAEARPIRGRPPVHAAGRAAACALRARVDARHPRGRPGVPRLALGAGRQQLPVGDGEAPWSRCTGRSSSAARRR